MIGTLGQAMAPVAPDLRLTTKEAAWATAAILKRHGTDKKTLLDIALDKRNTAAVSDGFLQVTFEIDDLSA